MQNTLAAHSVIGRHMPDMHRTDNSGWAIAEAMDKVLIRRMQDLLARVDFFSLTVDASVATDNTDYLNVEARLWCDGELHLLFMCLQPLGQDCSAAAQEKMLLDTLASEDFAHMKVEEWKRKLVAIAADGCSTMQGQHGGLLTRMQKRCPHMLKINCSAHRVNLAVEILDELPFFKRISDAVRAVASYFNRSPKRCARLMELQERLGLPMLKPITVNDTRWMPIYAAMLNLMRIYPAALRVLRESRDTEQSARALLHELMSAPVLFGMYVVEPLLSSLDELTKVNCHL